ncbi:hypothetical protein NKJ59_20155 [Mesorhizobium australicum]|uniref:hypothetical protein n=1 Tax=Mesorhizobium TaxID=68287 RepID=UPI0003CF8FE2|nr:MULTISPECIES: hypothetical protein [unclassified Mesorhizobium]ESY97610.1 hypothetical protein X741_00065 [Mesorhizobium sp. LNHC229A00]ESZ01898.1 hypothetical protein X738_03455 [Mesorhizobium sp. LNHC209A00]
MKSIRWMAEKYLAEIDSWRVAFVKVFGSIWGNVFFQAFFWLMVVGNIVAMCFGDTLLQ